MATAEEGAEIDYDIKEIVAYFRSRAPFFQLTEEHLRKPQSDFLHGVYRWLTSRLMNCDERIFEQIPFTSLENDMCHEMFHAAQQKLMLVFAVDTILIELGFVSLKFDMRDLISPTPKRTMRILTVLIDFDSVMDQRREAVANILKKVDTVRKDRDYVVDEIQELKEKINEERKKKAISNDRNKQLRQQIAELQQKLVPATKEHAAIKRETNELENHLRSELAALACADKTRLEEESHSLDQQIVMSPERVEREVGELRGRKTQLQREASDIRAQIQSLRDRRKGLEEVALLLESLMQDIEECEAEHEKDVASKTEKRRREETISVLRHRLDDVKLTRDEKKAQADTKHSQLEKLSRTHTAKLEHAERERQELLEKMQRVRQHASQDEVSAVDLEEQCEKLRQEMRDLQRDHDKRIHELEHAYKVLLDMFDSINADAAAFYQKVNFGKGQDSTTSDVSRMMQSRDMDETDD